MTNPPLCLAWRGEGADAGDVAADEQGLDGLGAFVGVQGFDVGERTGRSSSAAGRGTHLMGSLTPQPGTTLTR